MILDAIFAAGTNAAILFLKEAIVQRRLSKEESLEAVAGLPLYVRTPTQDVLNELYVICYHCTRRCVFFSIFVC